MLILTAESHSVLCMSIFKKETGAILAASNGMIDVCKVLLDHGSYPVVDENVFFVVC